jgi:hypothetical protein
MIKDGVKMRHGKGMFVEGVEEGSTPQSYEGEWSEDAMNGYGIFRYATNAKYEVRQDQASSPHDWPASAVGRQRAHGMCKPCPHRALLPHHLAGRVRQQPVFGAWHVHLPRRLDVRRCVQGGPDAWRRLLHRQAGTRHTAVDSPTDPASVGGPIPGSCTADPVADTPSSPILPCRAGRVVEGQILQRDGPGLADGRHLLGSVN